MRKNKLYVIIPIILIIGTILLVQNNREKKTYSQKLIDIAREDKQSYLTEEEREKFRENISKELDQSTDTSSKKKSYYALACIEYLKDNYNQSIDYGLKALTYEDKENEYLEIMILSLISSSYLQENKLDESEKYFEEAKSIASEKHMYEYLSELYFARGKAMLTGEYSLDEVNKLVEESNKYTTVKEFIVRNDLFLATTYRLKADYAKSLEYVVDALEISIKLGDETLINKCVINLGENYYVQGNFEKTINVYENTLDVNRLTDTSNILTVYAYLLDSYSKIGEYNNFKKYSEKLIDVANSLEEKEKNKELIWLYTVCAGAEIDFSNLDKAKENLSKAIELYDRNKENTYANMDLYMLNAKTKVEYYEDKNYEKALKSYEFLINKSEERGIKSDVMQEAIQSILLLSYENRDYDTTIEYLIKNEAELIREKSQAETDHIISKLSELENDYKLRQSKGKVLLLSAVIILMLLGLYSINSKNKKIKRLNKQLEELNKKDSLTKIYNKGFLNESLESLAVQEEKVVFVMLDIDHFKLYNDNYGHIRGDRALIKVSRILRDLFIDDLVFRYGGEEFSIVSKRSEESVVEDIEKLQRAIYEEDIEHNYSSTSDRITISIGIASCKVSTEKDIAYIMKAADENLYKSKNLGRNRYTL